MSYYVAPNSTFVLLKGVPLDETYDHTVYFSSLTEQKNWFKKYAYKTFEQQSYQRSVKGVLRIGIVSDDILECNYLMFNNTRNGKSKTFYAFINNVEYVSGNCTNVYYTIDDMQTWFFEFELGQCFVEREHSKTDGIGDNLIPEDLSTGEIITIKDDEDKDLIDMSYVFATYVTITAGTKEAKPNDFTYYYNFPTQIRCYNFENLNSLTELVKTYNEANSLENIAYIAPFPSVLFHAPISSTPEELVPHYFYPSVSAGTLDNYTPRNKKLFTYPFHYLSLTDSSGNHQEYRYEFFSNSTPVFKTTGSILSPSPEIKIEPIGYKGQINDNVEYLVYTMPQIPFVGSAYKAWISKYGDQANFSALIGTLYGAIQMGAGYLSWNPAMFSSGTVQIGSSLVGTALQYAQQTKNPANMGGRVDSNINYINKYLAPHYLEKSVTAEFAKTIDDYFSQYGYKTNRVKVPNRNVRERWCYCKTIGCNAHGSVPNEAMRNICNIYDRGITFWKSTADVGKYQDSSGNWLSNNPT